MFEDFVYVVIFKTKQFYFCELMKHFLIFCFILTFLSVFKRRTMRIAFDAFFVFSFDKVSSKLMCITFRALFAYFF